MTTTHITTTATRHFERLAAQVAMADLQEAVVEKARDLGLTVNVVHEDIRIEGPQNLLDQFHAWFMGTYEGRVQPGEGFGDG